MFSTFSHILIDTALTPIDDMIADIRLIKSPAEIDVIRLAARLVEQAYAAADGTLGEATSERSTSSR